MYSKVNKLFVGVGRFLLNPYTYAYFIHVFSVLSVLPFFKISCILMNEPFESVYGSFFLLIEIQL